MLLILYEVFVRVTSPIPGGWMSDVVSISKRTSIMWFVSSSLYLLSLVLSISVSWSFLSSLFSKVVEIWDTGVWIIKWNTTQAWPLSVEIEVASEGWSGWLDDHGHDWRYGVASPIPVAVLLQADFSWVSSGSGEAISGPSKLPLLIVRFRCDNAC